MNFWETFWEITILVSVIIFAGVALVVTLGGVADIRAMLQNLDQQHGQNTRGSGAGLRDDRIE